MYFRQLTSFLSAIFLGLSPVGAYIPEHLGGEGTQTQKTALQVESAILLREDGTPHCWIGENPSESLTAEKLDEFHRQGLDIDSAGLDALRECDKGDEPYAISVLGNEEISAGMAMPPTRVIGGLTISQVIVASSVVGFGIGSFLSSFFGIGSGLIVCENIGKTTISSEGGVERKTPFSQEDKYLLRELNKCDMRPHYWETNVNHCLEISRRYHGGP